jgi:hypothetical protein
VIDEETLFYGTIGGTTTHAPGVSADRSWADVELRLYRT